MPNYVSPCTPPTMPTATGCSSRWFGVPRNTIGRNGATVQGIVIHCLNMSLSEYDSLAGNRGSLPPSNKHISLHYAIGAEGQIHQYVNEENIAWGVGSYPGSFATTTIPSAVARYPGWPALAAAHPTTTLDPYVIHIGVATIAPSNQLGGICDDPCSLPVLNFSESTSYQKLVRLVAYLAQKYSIPVNTAHIQFHELIEQLANPSIECLCLEGFCFVCDVSEYCETCTNPFDASYGLGTDIRYLYGENEFGCKVKIHISDLRTLLGI